MRTKRNLDSVFVKAMAVFRALADKRTPLLPKVIGIAALAYILFPFDVMSDLVPFTGWIDDASIAGIALLLIAKLIPKQVLDEYRPGNRQ